MSQGKQTVMLFVAAKLGPHATQFAAAQSGRSFSHFREFSVNMPFRLVSLQASYKYKPDSFS